MKIEDKRVPVALILPPRGPDQVSMYNELGAEGWQRRWNPSGEGETPQEDGQKAKSEPLCRTDRRSFLGAGLEAENVGPVAGNQRSKPVRGQQDWRPARGQQDWRQAMGQQEWGSVAGQHHLKQYSNPSFPSSLHQIILSLTVEATLSGQNFVI